MGPERLQVVLARAGVAARRTADAWIAAGRVSVNGVTALPGQRVNPAEDRVTVDGRPVALRPEASVHYAIHKPRGVLSAARTERGRRSVVDLVPSTSARLWPVGRLDLDSEGLLFLSNDGPWANRVLHPRYDIVREYAALVDPAPDARARERLRRGVELDGGQARLLSIESGTPPTEVEVGPDERGTWLRLRIGEGRKREIRRLLAAVGSDVRRLVRTAVGPVTLAGLHPGTWRTLTAEEVAALAGAAHGMRVGQNRTVAIDGTSGSGKSTVGRALARRMGARFVDTGLLYRAVTLAALEGRIDPADERALASLARRSRIRVSQVRSTLSDGPDRVRLGRRDVTAELREPAVERAVPAVSRHPAVRAAMLEVQRRAARGHDTVMVGRDIGTVVLPEATLKVFLTASVEVRARRRAAQMGRPRRLARYRAEIAERDAMDTTRPIAPLRRAPGALVLDTGEMTVEACVNAILAALAGDEVA